MTLDLVQPGHTELGSPDPTTARGVADGRLLDRLRRVRDRLRPGRRRGPLGQPEHELLAALSRAGCPICHLLEGGERKYFFWFCNESYYEQEILAELTRSLGFCPEHGAYALRACGERSPFAVSHQAVVRRLLEAWRNERRRGAWEAALVARGGQPAACPACRASAEEAARATFFLARLLEEPRSAGRYARPGMLCWPHLQLIAPRLGEVTLEDLVHRHQAALRRAKETLAEPGRPERRHGEALWLAAGADRAPGGLRIAAPPAPAGARHDPVAALEHDLRAADGCPICLEVGRLWIAWNAWLESALRRGEAIGDVLPTCADHVWATFHAASPDLRPQVVGRALDVALVHLGHASQRFEAVPPKPGLRHPLRSLRSALQGRGPALAAARATLLRDLGCPLCRCLASVRDRTLLLLFALLEDRRYQAAFATSYGLCLRHYGRALALAPEPAVRALLREVEAARLARLEWELSEYARKAAWQARPEPKGAEQLAPAHAIRRFSGGIDPV